MPSSGGKKCARSEEHTSELQSHDNLVCRLLLEKKHQQLVRRPRAARPARGPQPAPAGAPRGVAGGGGGSRRVGTGVTPCVVSASFFFKRAAPPQTPPPSPPGPLPG